MHIRLTFTPETEPMMRVEENTQVMRAPKMEARFVLEADILVIR